MRPLAGMLRLAAAACVLMLVAVASAGARPLTAEERAEIAATVERFDAAMSSKNFTDIAGTIPPRILDHIAGQAGITVDQLNQVLITQMEAAFTQVELVSFAMDVDAMDEGEAADGQPSALIPTVTVVDPGTGKLRMSSHTLGLFDNGKWYLLRTSEAQQIVILRQVYPQFATIQLPSATTEAVKD